MTATSQVYPTSHAEVKRASADENRTRWRTMIAKATFIMKTAQR